MLTTNKEQTRLQRNIRGITVFFMVALVLSGITAFPVETGLGMLIRIFGISADAPDAYGGMAKWLTMVYEAIADMNARYPFLAYGYDWLAFAHLVIAVAFIGVYRDPVRNIWVVHFAMIACIGVIPLALICGYIRSIPFFWQLIDCSFGVFGIIPLYYLHRCIKRLEALTQ